MWLRVTEGKKREEVLLDFNRLVAMVGEGGDRKNNMGGLYCSVLHDGLLGAAGLYMYLTY